MTDAGTMYANAKALHELLQESRAENAKLREMADRCYADEDEPRDRDAIVAEYAAKLRLAGDE